MWTMRIAIRDNVLTYVGATCSMEALFEVFKERYPGAKFELQEFVSGRFIVPHDGEEYPYWFTRTGLTDPFHNMKFVSQEDVIWQSRILQRMHELPTAGHSDTPEEPKDEDVPI